MERWIAMVSNTPDNLAESFIRCGSKAVAALVLPAGGIWIGIFEEFVRSFCKAGWKWLKKLKKRERKKTIDELSRMPFDQVRTIATEELKRFNLPDDQKDILCNYIASIPMAARNTISRPNDGGKPKTLLSQLPDNEESLMRFMPLRAPLFKPGDKVAGHDLVLERLLGQGGFGEVWYAKELYRPNHHPMAIKFSSNATHIASLEREIKIYKNLSFDHPHENLVKLLGTAISAEPPFLMYEFVDGGNIVSWLSKFQGSRPPTDEILKVILMCARGLSHLHNHGVVHRDIKPSNILITRKGLVKIGDFGIGALFPGPESESKNGADFSETKTILSGAYTPLYTDKWWQVGDATNPQIDVYSLGVIAYQLLLAKITSEITPDWNYDLEQANISTEICLFVDRCIAHPARRYKNANEMIDDLKSLQTKGYSSSPNKKSKAKLNPIKKAGQTARPKGPPNESTQQSAVHEMTINKKSREKIIISGSGRGSNPDDVKFSSGIENKRNSNKNLNIAASVQSNSNKQKPNRAVPIAIAVVVVILINLILIAI